MNYNYYICDVFSNTQFAGNQLAVLPDARGLSDQQMQNITREFNFSESTFVFPAEVGNTRKVRIFTPSREIPFAGHPNIGTAFVLASIGELEEFEETTNIVFEEHAGLVPIDIRRSAAGEIWSELKAPENNSLGKTVSAESIASALSISASEVVTTTHLPQVASAGLPFLIVELRDLSSLEDASANLDGFRNISAQGIIPDIHLYIHSRDDFDIRARMFAPFDGVPEDPATGSANCALAGLLAHYNESEASKFSWRIAQGVEMGRPSLLDARAEKSDDGLIASWIGGACVMVAEGKLSIA